MFQALSDYGYQSAVEREQLVSELLFHLRGQQVGDDGFESLLDSTLRSLNHHKYLDVNPSEVDDLYRRLQDRLGEFAQFDKARVLGLLHHALAGAQVASEQYDFNHRVLAFLYSASRGALDSQYGGSALVERLLGDARLADRAKPTYLSDESSESEWAAEAGQQVLPGGGSVSEGSSLSDWGSDDEDTAARGEGLGREEGKASAGEAGPADPGGGGARPAPGTHSPTKALCLGSLPQRLPWLAAPLRESPYQRDSLAVWLAARQSGGQLARVLNPQLCFTERELLQQVLHMLKGVAHPGPAFQLDPVRGTYTVQPGVHMHCTSAAATRALLQRFASLGSQLRGVQELCLGMLHVGGSGAAASGRLTGSWEEEEEAEEQLRQLPTAGAFAAAVASQLKALQQQLIPLEVATHAGALTLLQLQHQLEGVRRQAAALQLASRQCVWRGSAAETSAGLLDALCNLVHREMMTGASQGGAVAAMLLQVFLATAKPFLDKLHAWAFSGDLGEDTVGELCIASDSSIPLSSSKFWASAYTLRRTSNGTPAMPSFLLPVADSLLAAGKSAVLLKASPGPPLPAPGLGAAAGELHLLRGSKHLAAAVSWQPGDKLLPGATPRACTFIPSQQGARRSESPTKRRLTSIQALGYAVATSDMDRPGLATPEGTLAEAGTAADLADSLQQPLYEHFVGSLQQLMAPRPSDPAATAACGRSASPAVEPSLSALGAAGAPSNGISGRGDAVPQGKANGVQAGAGVAAMAAAAGENEEEGEEEDWLEVPAACRGHTLSLAPADDLPSLQALPRSALQLQTPQAIILPEALPVTRFLVAAGSAEAGGGAGGQQLESQQQQEQDSQQQQQSQQQVLPQALSMGERMWQAAQQRVRQASEDRCTLDLLPAVQPPAALGQVQQVGGLNGRQDLDQDPSQAEAIATEFDSSSWAAWYRRVSHALSSELVASDAGLGGGLRGVRAAGGVLTQGCSGRWQQGPQLQRKEQASRLSPSMCTHAQPLDSLLQQCLLSPLQLQAQRIEAALAASLLQRWGLQQQLLTLREVFLLGSPLTAPFLHSFFLKISSRQGLEGVSEFDLNSALQQCFLSEGRSDLLFITAAILPPATDHAAAVDPGSGAVGQQPQQGQIPSGPAAAAGQAPGLPTVHTLSRLRLEMECGYPLCLVASEEMLQQYSAAMVLLMQLRWVKRSLDSLQRSKWKKLRLGSGSGSSKPGAGGGPQACPDPLTAPSTSKEVVAAGEGGGASGAVGGPEWQASRGHEQQRGRGGSGRRPALRLGERDGVLQQMAHLVDAVLQYTAERLLAAWQWLHEALAGCRSLSALQRCHAKYLRAVQRYCLLGQDTLSRLVHAALLRLLDCALHYCWLSSQAARAAAEGGRQGPAAVTIRQREAALRAQLASVRREFTSRQRLLVKVLASRAREVGAQADEMRHLLTAIDYNGFFQQAAAAAAPEGQAAV